MSGLSTTFGLDGCEPYQIMVLERRHLGSSRRNWTYEVQVWSALSTCPHWQASPQAFTNVGGVRMMSNTFRTLAKAREVACMSWRIRAMRGPGQPVASDPVFVDLEAGELRDPLSVPEWAADRPSVDKEPVWLDVLVGDDIFDLLD